MKAHTGMKQNQDVKVSILLYLIVKLNKIFDIHTMYNNSFHIFKNIILSRMSVGLL